MNNINFLPNPINIGKPCNCNFREKNQANSLERTPLNDSINFNHLNTSVSNNVINDIRNSVKYEGKSWYKNSYKISGENTNISVSESLTKGHHVKGTLNGNNVDFYINGNTLEPFKGKISGKINNEKFSLEYATSENNIPLKLDGTYNSKNKSLIPYISLLISDATSENVQSQQIIETVALADIID